MLDFSDTALVDRSHKRCIGSASAKRVEVGDTAGVPAHSRYNPLN
jgi:hypothetical protein